MSADHHIDSKNQLIVTTWEGEANDDELIEALMKYQKDIQCHPDNIGYNELVDFTKVTTIKFTTKGIKEIGRIASLTDDIKTNGKLAFIVSSNLAYGLLRMYEAYRYIKSKPNKEIRVFKNEKDALEWILDKP